MWPESVDEEGAGALADPGLPRRLGLGPGILLIPAYGTLETVVTADLSTPARRRWEAISDRTEAIVDELSRYHPRADELPRIAPIAEAWIMLRLAAANPPSARALADELIGSDGVSDDSLFIEPPDYDFSSDSDTGDSDYGLGTWLTLGCFMALAFGLVGWSAFRAITSGNLTRKRELSLPRDSWDTELTPTAVESELTALAERIAASDVQPGDPAYDRAQASADAAARFVDSDEARDRVGVHLLVEDGLNALLAEDGTPRCFFNPRHRARRTVARSRAGVGGAEVPSCHDCARAIKAGERPPALMLPDADGRVTPYYAVDDVWSRTGYGSLDPAWATVVLRDSLGIREDGR